jgi:hypothetical protein
MSRSREAAAANETKDIECIIAAINNRTPTGCRIIAAFKDKFGIEITAARRRSGSSRGTHYDFEVEIDGRWKRVEHKGGRLYRLPGSDDVPWKAGVQFYNGGCEKFSVARKYARTWYDKYIASGTLREEFGLTSPTPPFEEWFEKDCRTQDNPKTAFGIELKAKVRELRGPKASLLEKRAAVLNALEFTEEDKVILIAEAMAITKDVLAQKELWLSIHGNLEGDFHAVWYPQFTIDSIVEVKVEKALDLHITFVCSDGFKFRAILRWGKGAGFSCLRIDLK